MTDSTTSHTASKVILFVGSNPSNSSTAPVAFHASTTSSKILSKWCQNIEGIKAHINVLNKPTENNRPLKKSEIVANLDKLSNSIQSMKPDRIVALGKTAATALTLLRVEFYEMPHPSGRNRQLNDKDFEIGKVKGLEEYCSASPKTNLE